MLQAPPTGARPWLLALALAGLVLVVFSPALDAGFELFDDDLYVTDNPRVQAGLSLDGARWALTATEPSNWHPLTLLSHQLDVELYGLNPRGHHLTSLLIHAANAALLFLLLRTMTGRTGRSWAVAALFALHPLRVESVAWIAERKDVLSGLGFLLALFAYLRWTRTPGRGRYALLLAAFALALAAKSMVVTLPCDLLLLDLWPLRRLRPDERFLADLRARLVEKAPLFAVAAGMSALAVVAQGDAVADLAGVPLTLRLANAPTSIAAYLGKSFWPTGLAIFYPLPSSIPPSRAAAAAALVLGLTTIAVLSWRRAPWLSVGWLWFAGTLAPVLGILQVGNQAYADRYTYLPSIGLALAVVWGLAELVQLTRSPFARQALGPACAAGLVALAVVTSAQTRLWRESLTLWSHALAVTGPNDLTEHNLSRALVQVGRLEEALVHQRAAVALRPGLGQGRAALGSLLLRLDRPDEARSELELAVTLDPVDPQKHLALAIALERLGRLEEAAARLRQALAIDPDLAAAREGLSELDERLGRTLPRSRSTPSLR